MKKKKNILCKIGLHKWYKHTSASNSEKRIYDKCQRCGEESFKDIVIYSRYFICQVCGSYVENWEKDAHIGYDDPIGLVDGSVGFCADCYPKWKDKGLDTIDRLRKAGIPVTLENHAKHSHSNVYYDSTICGYRAYPAKPCKKCGWVPHPVGEIGSNLKMFSKEEYELVDVGGAIQPIKKR